MHRKADRGPVGVLPRRRRAGRRRENATARRSAVLRGSPSDQGCVRGRAYGASQGRDDAPHVGGPVHFDDLLIEPRQQSGNCAVAIETVAVDELVVRRSWALSPLTGTATHDPDRPQIPIPTPTHPVRHRAPDDTGDAPHRPDVQPQH